MMPARRIQRRTLLFMIFSVNRSATNAAEGREKAAASYPNTRAQRVTLRASSCGSNATANLHQDVPEHVLAAAIAAVAPVAIFLGVFDEQRIAGAE
jgi:hypothetical protein